MSTNKDDPITREEAEHIRVFMVRLAELAKRVEREAIDARREVMPALEALTQALLAKGLITPDDLPPLPDRIPPSDN